MRKIILLVTVLVMLVGCAGLNCQDCPYDKPCPVGHLATDKVDQFLFCQPEQKSPEAWILLEKNPDGSSNGKYITTKKPR